MTTLEEALSALPKLFTKTPTNTVVVAKPSHDGVLAVTATTPSNDTYQAKYDRVALQKLGATDFRQFFNTLAASFNENKCSSQADANKCNFDVPGCGRLELLTQPDINGHSAMLDNILSFTKLRMSKDTDRQLEEASNRAKDAADRFRTLVKEEGQLTETIAACREKVEYNNNRIVELQEELTELEEAKKKAALANGGGEEVFEEEDEEEVISRVRNPLGEKEGNEFDHELLRLVKSQYNPWPEDQVYDASSHLNAYCSVMKPMTSSEFATALSGLGEGSVARRVHALLQDLDKWDYDVFSLQEAMCGSFTHEGLSNQPQGGSLFITSFALMHRYNFVQKYNIKENILLNWLSLVEAGYHPNPYHNSMHAADVLHITNYIIDQGGLRTQCKLSDEDVFAALFAAAIHDYNHPGINNNFHIKVQTYLATLYNDRSILENIHVSSVFELMKMDKFNILDGFSDAEKRDIRDTIMEMVLATDMGLHSKILTTFKRRLAEDHDFKKKDDIRLALSMAVKMADISNCGRDRKLYLGWSNQIADEFYMQGDRERNLGFPCSPFMDRYQPSMAKGQIAFMNYIVVPLFECISELLPNMHFSVDLTEENKSYWANNDDS
ncbi:putative 3prime [Diplonema papillatum]|nr:putative 3prime [Diplonema papillatum]